MPSVSHETRVELVNREPEFIVRACVCFGVKIPKHYSISNESANFNTIVPRELRADSVQVLRDPSGKPQLAIVIEVQRKWDKSKTWAWPEYLACARSRLKCDVILVVICIDSATARRCVQTIRMGHPGWELIPLVLGPGDIPRITDAEAAAQDIGMAVLSALTHGPSEGSEEVLDAVMAALDTIDPERGGRYAEYLLSELKDHVRAFGYLEHLMMTSEYKFSNPYSDRLRAEGEAKGEARGELKGLREALLLVLAARGIEVSADVRRRVVACSDLDTLNQWTGRAAIVSSAEDLFS
jgi:hypothetical protein